jgi:hypothetical protein
MVLERCVLGSDGPPAGSGLADFTMGPFSALQRDGTTFDCAYASTRDRSGVEARGLAGITD